MVITIPMLTGKLAPAGSRLPKQLHSRFEKTAQLAKTVSVAKMPVITYQADKAGAMRTQTPTPDSMQIATLDSIKASLHAILREPLEAC